MHASPVQETVTNASAGTIDERWSVNETIRRFPATIAVFNEFGVDACCGGAAPITEAAREASADPVSLLHALSMAAGTTEGRSR